MNTKQKKAKRTIFNKVEVSRDLLANDTFPTDCTKSTNNNFGEDWFCNLLSNPFQTSLNVFRSSK